jgi:phage regulator Rha-like protein
MEQKIFLIRGHKVMLDSHLAELYGVKTKVLIQAVKRNCNRFPTDFMFQLTFAETKSLRSQIVTSNVMRGGRRYAPYAFTENGVAMLSSVLNSNRAIQVNIGIMRAFTKIREWLATHHDLQEKIEKLERKFDKKFAVVFQAIQLLLDGPEKPIQVKGFGKS